MPVFCRSFSSRLSLSCNLFVIWPSLCTSVLLVICDESVIVMQAMCDLAANMYLCFAGGNEQSVIVMQAVCDLAPNLYLCFAGGHK